MKKELFSALRITAVVFIIMFVFAYAYPTVVSVVDMHIDPGQANGSLIIENKTVYGSSYIAEAFNGSEFFHPRPSAVGYNLSQSGVLNYSIDNPQLLNITKNDIIKFEQENPGINLSRIPYSMVAYSGSGLDPNIPVSGASIQIPRIAAGLSSLIFNYSKKGPAENLTSYLEGLVNSSKEQTFPVFGSYYVNTVKMNFAILSYLKNDYGINLF